MPIVKPEDIARYVEQRIEIARERMGKFMERFQAYPAEALEWSQEVFDTAALLEALQRFQSQHDKGISLDDILKGCKRDLQNRARNPHRSTSGTSNLIEQSRHAAVAFIIEMLEE